MPSVEAIARVVDAAHAYCRAVKDNEAAAPKDWVSARTELDRTLHNLLLSCGFPCEFCEAGSCPGAAL